MRPAPLRLVVACLCLAVPGTPGAAEGQARLALEVQGGAAIPTGGFTRGPLRGGRLETAPAFGLDFTLRRNRWTGLYAGFSQLRFGCEADGCTGSGELVSTAWEVGGHLRLRPGPWGPWVRLGAVFARVESDLPMPGSSHQVSDGGIGVEVGVGWRFAITDGVGLNPGIRYSRLDSRLDPDTVFRMRYWVADLGLVLGF